MAQAPSWRTKLIERHPGLLHPPEGQPEAAAGYISCEEGWSDLIARLCVRMEAAQQQGETIRVLQIKKKLATLRVYWRGDVTPETAARLHAATALAKARSACTCETCGAEGRFYNLGVDYMARCTTHAQGELVPVPPGEENVHLVRVPMPDGYRVVARRYDRAADRFVDGDPTVLESKRPETAVTENWRADLMQAHPRLFQVLHGQSSFGYPQCEVGWRDVLEQLCTRIEAALGQNETFKFVRVGEKLSFLWIKWDGEVSDSTRARIEEAIDLASGRADRTCRTSRFGGTAASMRDGSHRRPIALRIPTRVALEFESIRRLQDLHLSVAWPGLPCLARYDHESDTLTEMSPLAGEMERSRCPDSGALPVAATASVIARRTAMNVRAADRWTSCSRLPSMSCRMSS